MATSHLSVHPNVSRGKGQSLVRTAAYNDRDMLVDERTGEVWDYRHLGETLASGIYAPKGAPDWARDLGQLVNEIERFEKRSDSQLAMNLDIGLPHEQTVEQNRRLMQDFVREEFQRKGYAAHFAIHPPDERGDERNFHAHVLVTLRKIDEHGFARTKTEQQERYRNRHEYVEQLREKWEHLANHHLERNGYDARIDMRSLKDQGILDREPEQHRGPTVIAMQREGNVTYIGQEIEQRKQDIAELRSLSAEEKRIDAQIIDLQAARAERQAREAARGQVDDIRPGADRARDFSASQTAPEAAQQREAPAASSAPGQENTRTTEAQRAAEEIFFREARPAREAPRVIHLGPPGLDYETEQQIIADFRREMRESAGLGERVVSEGLSDAAGLLDKGTHAASAFLSDVADKAASIISSAAETLFPTAPPTKEEAQGKQRAAEEQERTIEGVRSKAEQEAALQELLRQIRRDDAERERQARERGGRGDDDDYGGRERELRRW